MRLDYAFGNQFLFERIARIAAATVNAPIALVSLRNGRQLTIIGIHGFFLDKTHQSWEAGTVLEPHHTMSFVKDVRREPLLKNHPILMAAPFVRSLAHIPAVGYHPDFEAAITVLDPVAKWPFPATIFQKLI